LNAAPSFSRQRAWTLLSLAVIVPLGFSTKFYSGPAASWVNNSLGGVLYELFWCLVLFLFFRRVKPWRIAALVLVITCALEVLQLWRPPLLQLARSSFLGSALLGTTFTWSDFPYYVLGCGLGWVWMELLRARSDA
jgi:hypothetical protein